MRIFDFCSWANNELLPSSTLEPGFPRQISIETARRWLHQLGFEYLSPKKGSFVDGHERDDVVEYRKNFWRRMVTLGFLCRGNAPTSTAAESLPKDLEEPSPQLTAKTVIFFHDETTFQANDDQTRQWGAKGTQVVMQKSKGRGIMVSDFVSEDGFLCLSDDEIKSISDPNLKRYEAREQIEYGENADGYWTNDRFMNQMEVAVKLAEIKYPKDKGFRHCWVFDHSSCHSARSDDALDVSRMNVKPGGKQPKMRDTIWNGRVQKMNFSIGVPKGMKLILDERGVNTSKMNGDEMRKILSEMEDFKNETCRIEHFLNGKGHICLFLPKFHPELNPIERVWSQAKRYTEAYCKYSLALLRKNIPKPFDSITDENIANYYKKVRQYMHAGGPDLEKKVQIYKKEIKSHRRISDNQ